MVKPRYDIPSDSNTIVAKVAASEMRRLPGMYPGIPVVADIKQTVLAIGVAKEPMGWVKEGLLFAPLPDGWDILAPVPVELDPFTKVALMLEGKTPETKIASVRDRVKAKWWISAYTRDPLHILLDWDGVTFFTSTGKVSTILQ